MNEAKGWPAWLEISENWERILAVYRFFLIDMLWIFIVPAILFCAFLGSVPLLLMRILIVGPLFLFVAWLIHACTGFVATLATYFFSWTLGHPFAPRSFNIIVYGQAYFLVAVLLIDTDIIAELTGSTLAVNHSNAIFFFLSLVTAILGWINSRRFAIPSDRQPFSFTTRQIFTITGWISVALPAVLVDSYFFLHVAIWSLGIFVVLLAGRLLNR